jgi:hypothetical protein
VVDDVCRPRSSLRRRTSRTEFYCEPQILYPRRHRCRIILVGIVILPYAGFRTESEVVNVAKHHGCSNFVTEFPQMVQVKFFKIICKYRKSYNKTRNLFNFIFNKSWNVLVTKFFSSLSHVFCYGRRAKNYSYSAHPVRQHSLPDHLIFVTAIPSFIKPLRKSFIYFVITAPFALPAFERDLNPLVGGPALGVMV